MDKLGIEKLTPLAGFIGDTVSAVFGIDENQDGKVSWMEIINKVQVIGFKAFGTFSGFNLKDVQAQAADLDFQELEQLINEFSEKFDIRRDELELLIERWLDWVADGASLIADTINLRKLAAA